MFKLQTGDVFVHPSQKLVVLIRSVGNAVGLPCNASEGGQTEKQTAEKTVPCGVFTIIPWLLLVGTSTVVTFTACHNWLKMTSPGTVVDRALAGEAC